MKTLFLTQKRGKSDNFYFVLFLVFLLTPLTGIVDISKMTPMNEQPIKTASQMLWNELCSNKGLDIVERLMTKPPVYSLTSNDLTEAANLITQLRHDVQAFQRQAQILSDAIDRKDKELQNAWDRIESPNKA